MVMIVLLSACSKQSGDSPPGTDTRNTGSASPSSQNSASNQAPVKIHIVSTHGNAVYAMQLKSEDDPYVQELSRLSGYDLFYEYLGHADDYVQQLTVRFASGDLPDMLRTNHIDSTIHPGAVDEGVFQELGNLIEQYGSNIKKAIPEDVWNDPAVSKDGKIYGIPALTVAPATRTVFVRQDWLDMLHMDQPQTIDEYLAFFEAVKTTDMNGNGEQDEYGFYARENLAYSDMFFQAFGVHPQVWHMQDGQMTPDMIRPEMKDAIQFYKMLYDEGYMNPNLFTNKSPDWQAGIFQGKGGLWAHEATDLPSIWPLSNFVNQPDVKISAIAPPEGPRGRGMNPERSRVSFVWVIPTNSDKAEEVIKFLNWIYSDEPNELFAYGLEGVNFTRENGEIKWDPTAPENTDNLVSDFYQVSMNPRGDGRMVPEVIALMPDAEVINRGLQIAQDALIKHDNLYMPVLSVFNTNPELVLGYGAGTLFLDMFAKVVTGREELNSAFDNFVAEWKRRGGNEAINEATAWYNQFHQ